MVSLEGTGNQSAFQGTKWAEWNKASVVLRLVTQEFKHQAAQCRCGSPSLSPTGPLHLACHFRAHQGLTSE
jgi:hypothetical protein